MPTRCTTAIPSSTSAPPFDSIRWKDFGGLSGRSSRCGYWACRRRAWSSTACCRRRTRSSSTPTYASCCRWRPARTPSLAVYDRRPRCEGGHMPPSMPKLVEKYRVVNGKNFRLDDIDPGDTAGFDAKLKDEAKQILARGAERLSLLQEQL